MPRSLASPPPSRRSYSRHAKGWTVLVVSEDLLVRLGVRDMLEELGNTVYDAPDVTGALDLLAIRQDIDAMVLDIGGDGETLALHRTSRRQGIICTTDTRKMRVTWADVSMPKPFSLESLAFSLMQLGVADPQDAGAQTSALTVMAH